MHKCLLSYFSVISVNLLRFKRSPSSHGHDDHAVQMKQGLGQSTKANVQSFTMIEAKKSPTFSGKLYPFSHNPGSGKWPCLKGNNYWGYPIFHFHDYGRNGTSSL